MRHKIGCHGNVPEHIWASNTWFLRSIRAHNSNGISIGSAVFSQITEESLYFLSPSKIAPSHGVSGPPSNTWFPTPTRVLNPNDISIGLAVLQGSLVSQTDRPTYRPTNHDTRSVTIGHIYVRSSTAMRPNVSWMSWGTGDSFGVLSIHCVAGGLGASFSYKRSASRGSPATARPSSYRYSKLSKYVVDGFSRYRNSRGRTYSLDGNKRLFRMYWFKKILRAWSAVSPSSKRGLARKESLSKVLSAFRQVRAGTAYRHLFTLQSNNKNFVKTNLRHAAASMTCVPAMHRRLFIFTKKALRIIGYPYQLKSNCGMHVQSLPLPFCQPRLSHEIFLMQRKFFLRCRAWQRNIFFKIGFSRITPATVDGSG